ncbi:sugar phosphate isomerase/epimerase [Halobacteriales archaeon QS_1_67_19]|nr:MAG: sugar phosphate isomerase/epimerase [Halobacteriales archaeon QS_1_67_19]
MSVRQGFTVENGADLDASLSFAADHGFDFVELNMDWTFERQRVDSEAVRETAVEYGVDLLVHLPYRLDPGSPHEHVREGACRELEAAIDAAVAFGAEKGVIHATSHAHPEKWNHEKIREYLYDSVRRLADYGRERDFEVSVENLKTLFFDAGDFPDLFAETDSVACLDTGHAYVTGQDAAAQADLLRTHGDRISHVHLNETRRGDEDEHLPVGIGEFDFETLAEAMDEADWSGTCTHEVYTYDREYVAHGKAAFDRLL